MEKFFSNTKNFIFAKQKSIFSSAVLLSFMIVLTSISGFLRYRILAGYFNKEELDIFYASFRIPDLIYEILITGAITSTFIPIYVKFQKNRQELSENISSIINLILFLLTVFIIVISFFIGRIIPILTPGYSYLKMERIVNFSRLLLFGQLPFFILGNFLTGIGQANKTFFLSAVAPVLYNVAIIIFTVIFSQTMGLSAPVIGVIIGAVLLFIIQLPLLFSFDYDYKLLIRKTKGLIEFSRLVGPRAFTVVVAQIDATIDLTLATLLGSGSYTVFYLAQHLQLLPVSVIGIAFGQASLPYLTEIFHENRVNEFKKIIIDSMLNILFLIIPISVFFIFARTPLVRLFFGGDKFDWQATVQTAITLSYFSIALPFHAVYYLLTRCFYAVMDSKTPFYISVAAILVNTILSLLFVFYFHFPIWALAISFSISMILNSTTLFLFLCKKVPGFDFRFLILELGKILFSSSIAGVVAYFLMRFLDGLVFDTTRTINVFFLIGTVGIVFIGIYLFIAWITDLKEMYLLTKLVIKAREYQKKVIEVFTPYE